LFLVENEGGKNMGVKRRNFTCQMDFGEGVVPLLVLTAVVKIPEGVAIGFQIFAWAPY
jgi:hypothetical protein